MGGEEWVGGWWYPKCHIPFEESTCNRDCHDCIHSKGNYGVLDCCPLSAHIPSSPFFCLQLHGLVGTLVRLPFTHPTHSAPASSATAAAAGAALTPTPQDSQSSRPRSAGGTGITPTSTGSGWGTAGGRQPSGGGGVGRRLRLGGREWVPSLLDRWVMQGAKGVWNASKESRVRGFASGGVSVQLGSMRGWLLDFTRLEVRADLGLAGQSLRVKGRRSESSSIGGAVIASSGGGSGGGGNSHNNSSGAGGGVPHRSSTPASPAAPTAAARIPGGSVLHAFGSSSGGCGLGESNPSWHSLSASLRQQLIGPLRLCLDARFELNSSQPCPHPGWPALRAPLGCVKGLGRHVGGMRPVFVEGTYGVDCVVPGSQGLGRVVAWWSPQRREAMVELRLL